MTKTILITGSTDGIGRATAKRLVQDGHTVLLHGRSRAKLDVAIKDTGAGAGYVADLSSVDGARKLAAAVRADHPRLDVLINNAGVLKAPQTTTNEGFDLRYMVNTIAPYALTLALLPIMGGDARVVNLSSAAQAPFDLAALDGGQSLGAQAAYAQSKLAITAWTQALAEAHPEGPSFYAVNPGSLLATKMVKEGFGVAGSDIGIGADILARAATSSEFQGRSGAYFDNDGGRFADPHPFARDAANRKALITRLDAILDRA